VPIPTDAVTKNWWRARPWNIERSGVHSLHWTHQLDFDYSTFFSCSICSMLDPSGHVISDRLFVESLMTQTLIIHIIRTNKIPFFQSRASCP